MITLDKAALLAAIKKVLPGVEKGKTTIEGADQLLFTGTHVYSHNGIVSVAAPCDTQGNEFAVKGMNFYNLVARLDDLILTAEVKGNKLKLSAGRTKVNMPLLDTAGIKAYVSALDVEHMEFEALPEGFSDAVKICTMGNNLTPLKGVAVGPHGDMSAVFSTDKDRISIQDLPSAMPTIWMDDAMFADAFKVGDPVEFCSKGPWLHLKYEDGTVFSAQKKDCAGYPFSTCSGIVDSISTGTVQMEGRLPKDLNDAVSRVAVLASGTDSKGLSLVEMAFHKDCLELHAEGVDGDATETVPWDSPLGDEPGISIYVTVPFLVEAARKTMDFSLVSLGKNPAMVFRSGDYIQMVSTTTK